MNACDRNSTRRGTVFDIPSKEQELAQRQQEAQSEDFWSDPQRAAQHQQRTDALTETVQRWNALKQDCQDLHELRDLIEAPQPDSALEQLDTLTKEWIERAQRLEAAFHKRERDLLVSQPYDDRNAIIEIHAGAGGVDAMDWAAILQRMYVRYIEHQEAWSVESMSESKGEEAGIKSASLFVNGPYAYGYLKAEHGSHRLVRQSPFNANALRQTSFAAVHIFPEIASKEIDIDPKDLKIDTFRASGAGGQHVNTTDSAVRITHIPTGLVVTSQHQRSQHQNKESALNMLAAKLAQQQEEREAQERLRAGGAAVHAGWGNRIRSYVLHPYKLVKDHRTNHETNNVDAVLDGDLQSFIEAELRRQHEQRETS